MMERYVRHTVPPDWPSVIASERERTTRAIADLAAKLTTHRTGRAVASTSTSLELLPKALVVLGPDAVWPIADRFGDVLQLGEAGADALSAANAIACCGGSIDAPVERIAELTAKRRKLRLLDKQTLAFAAIALGDLERVPALIGGGRLARRFEEGRRFGLDVAAFTRYVASATALRVPLDAVRPAWAEFLATFVSKRALGSLLWRDLPWVARGLAARDGFPASEAGRWLAAEISGALSGKAALG